VPNADGRDHPVDRRYVSLQRIAGWLAAAVLGSVLFLGLAIAVGATRPAVPLILAALVGWVLVVALLAGFGHFWPSLEYRHLAYRVSSQEIRIRRGVIWREVIDVPRNRIQHIDVSQGPLERQFGLATLLVHTAGTDFARISLPGLAHERALEIRDRLLGMEEDDAL
jgi:membrane protein YdbS with pleckstrin-like domain